MAMWLCPRPVAGGAANVIDLSDSADLNPEEEGLVERIKSYLEKLRGQLVTKGVPYVGLGVRRDDRGEISPLGSVLHAKDETQNEPLAQVARRIAQELPR